MIAVRHFYVLGFLQKKTHNENSLVISLRIKITRDLALNYALTVRNTEKVRTNDGKDN